MKWANRASDMQMFMPVKQPAIEYHCFQDILNDFGITRAEYETTLRKNSIKVVSTDATLVLENMAGEFTVELTFPMKASWYTTLLYEAAGLDNTQD